MAVQTCDVHRRDFLKESNLFKKWETMRQEILLHKWYESEKAGRDIPVIALVPA